MSDEPRWEFYTSPSGRSPVRDEIAKAKLSKREANSLAKLLTRYVDGQTLDRDVKFLKQYGLHELRFAADHRSFRLLFVRRLNGGPVLLALVFAQKKADKLPSFVFETAKERRSAWELRDIDRD